MEVTEPASEKTRLEEVREQIQSCVVSLELKQCGICTPKPYVLMSFSSFAHFVGWVAGSAPTLSLRQGTLILKNRLPALFRILHDGKEK